MDATDLSSRRDDDNDRDTNVNGWGSPGVSEKRDPTLAGNHVECYSNSASTFPQL